MPFVITSLIVPLGIAIYRKQRSEITKVATLLFLTLVLYLAVGQLWQLYMRNHTQAATTSTDPYAMVRDLNNLFIYVITFNRDIRIGTPLVIIISMGGLVSIIGVVWYSLQEYKHLDNIKFSANTEILRIMAWTLTVSWIGWFLFLSIGWLRYAFPGIFLGNMFAAYLIDSFLVQKYLNRELNIQSKRSHNTVICGRDIAALLFVVIIIITTLKTATRLYQSFIRNNNALEIVANYLNENISDNELIETYESELLFLLDKPYHFPPDEVQHLVNRRLYLDHDVVIDYDPLQLDPDYIVVGVVNSWWHLYDDLIKSDEYQLILSEGSYKVYKKSG
jgi:hypothetical protein